LDELQSFIPVHFAKKKEKMADYHMATAVVPKHEQ